MVEQQGEDFAGDGAGGRGYHGRGQGSWRWQSRGLWHSLLLFGKEGDASGGGLQGVDGGR